MLDIAFICTIFGVFILLSFRLGYQYGNSNKKNISSFEEKKDKKVKIKKSREKEDIDKQLQNFYTAINNIENYNGTSEGQEVIK